MVGRVEHRRREVTSGQGTRTPSGKWEKFPSLGRLLVAAQHGGRSQPSATSVVRPLLTSTLAVLDPATSVAGPCEPRVRHKLARS